MRPSSKFFTGTALTAGAVSALAISVQNNSGITLLLAAVRAIVCAPAALALFSALRFALRRVVRSRLGDDVADRYDGSDEWSYGAALITLTSAAGVQLIAPVWIFIALTFAAMQGWAVRAAMGTADAAPREASRILAPLFFLSGTAALIYQVAWQRTLYAHFGVNLESITIIVSIFMFGLGIGALAGGRLSKLSADVLPWIFVGTELGIALFGAVSIPIIQRVGAFAEVGSVPLMAATVFALLAFPTFLMGATLPVLVAYLERETGDVEVSVARLYFVNTLGSAFACFITVDVLFAFTGLRGSTIIAAACNAGVAMLGIAYLARRSDAETDERPATFEAFEAEA